MTDTKDETPKHKSIDVFTVHPTTPIALAKLTKGHYCVSFDFGNATTLGIGVQDPQVAAHLGKCFVELHTKLNAEAGKDKVLHLPKHLR